MVPGEGKQGSTGSSGAAFASALSEVPPDSGADARESDSAEEYDDDNEWEADDEEYAEDEADPDSSAATRREERGERGGRGTSGPRSLERSFRESFASVNGVLSAIAGKSTLGSFIDSARGGAETYGAGGNRDRPVGGRHLRSSKSPGEAEGRGAASIGSLPASPDPVSLPPTTPFGPVRGSRETASGGKGIADTAFRLTPEECGEDGTAGGAAGGFGGRAGEGGQLPAEMSAMLQRYSEMMLKVVQVRLL